MPSTTYDYLAKLTLEPVSGLYDLFITTYSGRTVQLRAFFLEKKHEMRMDLVSDDIYRSPEYVGTLCQLNSILNPFSVSNGDIIFYCTRDDAESLMRVASELKFARIEELISAGKSTLTDLSKKAKSDPNRRNFFNKRAEQSLSPTMLPKREQNITAGNGFITIGGSNGGSNGTSFLGQPNNFAAVDSGAGSMLTLNDMLANDYKVRKTSAANSDLIKSAGNAMTAGGAGSGGAGAGEFGSVPAIDSLALLQEVLASGNNLSQYGTYDDTKAINTKADEYDRILVKRYIRKIE